MLALLLLVLTSLTSALLPDRVHELHARDTGIAEPSRDYNPAEDHGDDHSHDYLPTTNPFIITPAFVITLNLTADNPAFQEIQSPLSTGTQTVRPIISGTVTGPLLNGIIYGGLGWVSRYTNPSTYLHDGVTWGVTDDGESFAWKDRGVGNPGGKVDRIEITIGGKYAYLNTAYLLQATEVNRTAAGAILRAEVFLVGSTLETT